MLGYKQKPISTSFFVPSTVLSIFTYLGLSNWHSHGETKTKHILTSTPNAWVNKIKVPVRFWNTPQFQGKRLKESRACSGGWNLGGCQILLQIVYSYLSTYFLFIYVSLIRSTTAFFLQRQMTTTASWGLAASQAPHQPQDTGGSETTFPRNHRSACGLRTAFWGGAHALTISTRFSSAPYLPQPRDWSIDKLDPPSLQSTGKGWATRPELLAFTHSRHPVFLHLFW